MFDVSIAAYVFASIYAHASFERERCKNRDEGTLQSIAYCSLILIVKELCVPTSSPQQKRARCPTPSSSMRIWTHLGNTQPRSLSWMALCFLSRHSRSCLASYTFSLGFLSRENRNVGSLALTSPTSSPSVRHGQEALSLNPRLLVLSE